jgi:integrase
MSRAKYQRPEVYAWKGKSGEKFWKAEWRLYIEGRPKPKHRAATWPCKDYSKTEAQQACDQLVQEETGGLQRPDGSMTVGAFWEKVYWPTKKLRVSPNTEMSYRSSWETHLEPRIGKVELQHVSKAALSAALDKMANDGKSLRTIQCAQCVMTDLFREALESGYIIRNPAWRVTVPRAKEPTPTRAMSEDEVRQLFDTADPRDRLYWRILIFTGARIGEMLALCKNDLLPGMLRIDESAHNGKAAQTKNRKIRRAAIPDSLWRDIKQHAATVEGEALFPNTVGGLHYRFDPTIRGILKRARKAAGIPDLTFRMCRTTFATLYDGDYRDLQDTLGHSTVDITSGVYRKPQAARQKANIEELEARLTGKVVQMPARANVG